MLIWLSIVPTYFCFSYIKHIFNHYMLKKESITLKNTQFHLLLKETLTNNNNIKTVINKLTHYLNIRLYNSTAKYIGEHTYKHCR